MSAEFTLVLGTHLGQPKLARDFAARHLARLPRQTCDDVLLLVSELVTNVIRHGAAPARLHIVIEAERVGVTVFDSGGTMPPQHATRPPGTQGGGRGLLIVEAIATAWGVRHEIPAGKSVWFEMAYPQVEVTRSVAEASERSVQPTVRPGPGRNRVS